MEQQRMMFRRYIGVDYSGAGDPGKVQKGIKVALAEPGELPALLRNPHRPGGGWSRLDVGQMLEDHLHDSVPTIVGMDFSFAIPVEQMDDHSSWDAFLCVFRERWRTHERSITKKEVARVYGHCPKALRLTEQWTSSAKSVFDCNGPGVALATFAGIPWLLYLRENLPTVHFWPFDGFDVPAGTSVITEVYPSIVRNRYVRESRNSDAHDAYSVARWLRDCDARGILPHYFHPPLTPADQRRAQLEGWILGIS